MNLQSKFGYCIITQNFKYCTLFVSGTELRTDGRTDDPMNRCPRRTFQAGGIKKTCLNTYCKLLYHPLHKGGTQNLPILNTFLQISQDLYATKCIFLTTADKLL